MDPFPPQTEEKSKHPICEPEGKSYSTPRGFILKIE
jgi:hypothetical protein